MVDILKMIIKELTYLESLFTTFEWTLELFWHAEEEKTLSTYVIMVNLGELHSYTNLQ